MAHFAELNNENIVLRVLVVNDEILKDETGFEQEQKGIDYLQSLFGLDTIWKQTSYDNLFRVRYAGPEYLFNPDLDAFIPSKPYPSWVLDVNIADWVAPIPKPGLTPEEEENRMTYIWDESIKQWTLVQGP